MANKNKNSLKGEFQEIVGIISGEMKLREKEEEITKLKEKIVKGKKAEKRKKITSKEIVLEQGDLPTEKVVQNIKLYEWSSPERVQIKLEGKTFWIVVAISLVGILYLAILGQYWLMGALIALLFFIYVLGTTKPYTAIYRITAKGVEVGGKLYEWFMLDNFWFANKDGQYILVIETKLRLPKAFVILLDKSEKDPIFVLLQEKVLYKDIRKQDYFDKKSYGIYIPLEEI
jgi:hypothetical protein